MAQLSLCLTVIVVSHQQILWIALIIDAIIAGMLTAGWIMIIPDYSFISNYLKIFY